MLTMKKIILTFAAAILTGTCFGYSYQIDDAESQCIIKNFDNEGEMVKCVQAAQGGWQKEIDNNLENLKNLVNKSGYKNLQKSQKEWEKFKKAEFNTAKNIAESRDDTCFTNRVYEDYKKELLKQRAMTLDNYIQSILDSRDL